MQRFCAGQTFVYVSKIKLHGTNAAVQIDNGNVLYQSRSRLISPGSDNAGFAAWASQYEAEWLSTGSRGAGPKDSTYVFYGEWFGPGIQKKVACSEVPEKSFAIFAVDVINYEEGLPLFVRHVMPDEIRKLVPNIPNLYVLPIYNLHRLEVDDEPSLLKLAEHIDSEVEAIDKLDPWIKDTFGIEGIGEGLVMYPIAGTNIYRPELLFKVKGQSHSVNKVKKAMDLNPEDLATLKAFLTSFVTENRLEQGLKEACEPELDITQIGAFIKWVVGDIQKESKLEIEANNIPWNKASKAISGKAATYFKSKLNTL